MLSMRALALGTLGASLAAVLFPAAVATASAPPNYASAYSYAMRCFVLDGIAIPTAADDPDGVHTRSIRDMARHAYDTAYLLGGKLGYSEQQIASDFDRAQGVEMRLLMQNPDYLARTKADCARLGLM